MPEKNKKISFIWNKKEDAAMRQKLKKIRTADAPVEGRSIANDAKPATEIPPEVGQTMKDGTIYIGVSPDSAQAMYAAPVDAPKMLNFNAAAAYAKNLDVGGKKDFRVPTQNELDLLFQNQYIGSFKGTFNRLAGLFPESLYWSSTSVNSFLTVLQDFFDGTQKSHTRDGETLAAVRCIRCGP